ncbi:hypothetical protein Bhyg_12404 [Pseudolycoriella hygida]|uniref:Uncharacterized protein n=1 Tax=Pseudolycoriella hygida TaxID=35572 RepID=A0A9Q0MZI0_9DIPT|nr:hypothetical protein Bhyg_12404 [Pseudolycoriella hygida]
MTVLYPLIYIVYTCSMAVYILVHSCRICAVLEWQLKMNAFALNTKFEKFASVLAAKKEYEEASKSLLTITACHKRRAPKKMCLRSVNLQLQGRCGEKIKK